MDNPKNYYWQLRLKEIQKRLEKNRFEAHVVADTDQAKNLVLDTIVPACAPQTISWGGSLTFTSSGLYKYLKSCDNMEIIDTFRPIDRL